VALSSYIDTPPFRRNTGKPSPSIPRIEALDTVWKHPVLWKPQDVSAAIRYVVDEPGNPMAVFRDYRNLKKGRSRRSRLGKTWVMTAV
jgi:hypothetical protein